MKRMNRLHIARWACALFFACCFAAVSPTASGAVMKVRVVNKMSHPIWVVIDHQKRHITEKKTKTVSDTDFETYFNLVEEGKIALPIEGVPIEASMKQQREFKMRLKVYYEKNQEAKYEWSDFITAGELEIAPGKCNVFSRTEGQTYYIWVRTMGKKNLLANGSEKSESYVVIDKTGHVQDSTVGPAVLSGAPMYLKAKNRFVGEPVVARLHKTSSGTFDEAAGLHKIVKTNDKSGKIGKPLKSGDLVRLVSGSQSLGKNNIMHVDGGTNGWIYYQKHSDSKAQQWKIMKVKGSSGGIHYGDTVKLQNLNWQTAHLAHKDEWLNCPYDSSKNASNILWVVVEQIGDDCPGL